MRISLKELGLVFFILAFGVCTRFIGYDALLPQRPAPDTYMVNQAILLKLGGAKLLASRPELESKYPQLMAQVLRLLLPKELGRADCAPFFGDSPESILKSHLYQASAPYLFARTLVIFLSVLLIPASWLLARRFLGKGPSLFAAALTAASLLHAVYSKQARPHAPEASFILLALLSYLWVMRDTRLWVLILSGIFTTLAICCLQNGFFTLPALALALFFNRKRIYLKLGVLILIIGSGLFIFYASFLSGSFRISGVQHGILNFDHTCFHTLLVHLFRYDPVLGGLALLGILFLIPMVRTSFSWEQNKELMVILGFALPYALIIGLYGQDQVRYLLPLVPMFAGLAALGASKITSHKAGGLVFLLLLVLPVYATGKLALLQARPDTFTQTAQWFEKNADHKKIRIFTGVEIHMPLFYEKSAQKAQSIWTSPWGVYQKQNLGNLPKWKIQPVEAAKTAYNKFSLNTNLFKNPHKKKYLVIKQGSPIKKRILKSSKKFVIKPVARFDILEGSDKTEPIFYNGYQDKHMLHRVLMGKAWGPSIEIYEMGPAKTEKR